MKAVAHPHLPGLKLDKPPVAYDQAKAIGHIRRLIWVYLVLLIFEGTLRKWVLPQFSSPLLLVRDPVLLAIYALAIRARIFPQNVWVITLEILAALSWISGIIVMQPYFPLKSVILVTGFGVRSNFLHLPLIFIIARVLDREDVRRVGWWTIAGMIPLALLMAMQFAASPYSLLNVAAGGEGTQMFAGAGKVRPAGFFSFVSGTVYYAAATAAFLLHAIMAKLPYKQWLLYSSAGALIVALSVSGSRSTVLAVLAVIAAVAVILLIRPSLVNRFGRQLLIVVAVLWAVSYLPIVQQGLDVLWGRFTESTEDATVVGGLFERILQPFSEAGAMLGWVPLGGRGIGLGTSGGASFLTGEASFLLAENEWTRILLESGPILGTAFILWRTAFLVKLGWFAVRQVRAGNTLPMFLFAAGMFVILQGTFGQPTSLGFAVVLGGLCLAARAKEEAEPEKPTIPAAAERQTELMRPRRRSAYAAHLHTPRPRPFPDHGPADR